jgi:hypothetical protein
MSGLSNIRETYRPRRPFRQRSLSPAVEGLDQRALPSAGMGHALAAHAAEVSSARDSEHNGTVVKKPKFYEDYVGPRLAQLNAVSATGQLLRNGNFHFLAVNQGAIHSNVRATYVFGVDRSGKLTTGPFPGRPNIRFDATVVVKLVPGHSPTITVNDLARKTSRTLPDSDLLIQKNVIAVGVPASLLPSTGLNEGLYRYAYWPEDGQAGFAHIASFAPQLQDIPIGIIDGGE